MNTELLENLSGEAKADLVNDMRDWIKDCQWADVEEWQVDEMSDEELLRGVESHYDGGVDQFIKDNDKA